MLDWLPIRASSQMVFAEAFAQMLVAGVPLIDALYTVASVSRGLRWRPALFQMVRDVRCNGLSLEQALRKSGARVRPGLLEALRIGQDRGTVARELHAFAESLHRNATRLTGRALGRSRSAMEFAQALSRQLQRDRLTVSVVADAGRIVAARDRYASWLFTVQECTLRKRVRLFRSVWWFPQIVHEIESYIENGSSLGEVCKRYPWHFDLPFCLMVDACKERQSLRRILSILGGNAEAMSDSPGALETVEPELHRLM